MGSCVHCLWYCTKCIDSNHNVIKVPTFWKDMKLYILICLALISYTAHLFLISVLDAPSQTRMLLGDKQERVTEYNTCILMALWGVVRYAVVFICRKNSSLYSKIALRHRCEPTQSVLTVILYHHVTQQPSDRCLFTKGLAHAHRDTWFPQAVLCVPSLLNFCQIQAEIPERNNNTDRSHFRLGSNCFSSVNTDWTFLSCFEMIFKHALAFLS